LSLAIVRSDHKFRIYAAVEPAKLYLRRELILPCMSKRDGLEHPGRERNWQSSERRPALLLNDR
jgi:hypothetical protein